MSVTMGRKAEAKRERVERMIRFPQPLYRRLSAKAEREQRSIQGQVIAELERNIPDDAS
jgi:hypothetical protein